MKPGQVISIVNSDGSLQTVSIAGAAQNQQTIIQRPQTVNQTIAQNNPGMNIRNIY